MYENLKVIGTDGTASMTGPHSGFIRSLEELMDRPLQWAVCLLHADELPFRHVFIYLDGTTNGPDSFQGPIGKQIDCDISELPVKHFLPIGNRNFPYLTEEDEIKLSTDHLYSYNICKAVI